MAETQKPEGSGPYIAIVVLAVDVALYRYSTDGVGFGLFSSRGSRTSRFTILPVDAPQQYGLIIHKKRREPAQRQLRGVLACKSNEFEAVIPTFQRAPLHFIHLLLLMPIIGEIELEVYLLASHW